MFRYIMDKVKKLLPVALIIIVLSIVTIVIGYGQCEETAALYFGLFMLVVGLMFVIMAVGTAVSNLMQWKSQGILQKVLDEYAAARTVANNVRLGESYLFFFDGAVAYSDIRSMHTTTKLSKHTDGSATTFFVLSAGVAGGSTKEIMQLPMNTSRSAGKANEIFKEVMDHVAKKNPAVRMTYKKF